jgi:hypothetical protein
MAAIEGDAERWRGILETGPEQWMLNRVNLTADAFEPLSSEALLAGLASEDGSTDPFDDIVLIQYLDLLQSDRIRREELEAEGIKLNLKITAVALALNVFVVFQPELAPLAAKVDAALAVYGAATVLKSAFDLYPAFDARLKSQFAASMAAGSFEDYVALGEALSTAPSAADYATLLFQAGVSMATAAAALKIFPVRRLQLLQAMDLALSVG